MKKYWSQPLRVECKEKAQLITSRTVNSRLWFINNSKLEERILPFVAKYQEKYGVEIYAFVILGNHYHLLARFPRGNRAHFCRDFNARLAEAVRICVDDFLGGPLLERRYSPQVLPLHEDTEKYFYYCALQAVSAGLTQRISEYPGYNSLASSIGKRTENYTLFNFSAYKSAKRFNPGVSSKDYMERYTLIYSKLPHLNHLSDKDYRKQILSEVEHRRNELVRKRHAEGKTFLGRENILRIKAGALPLQTKRGGMRPIVLSCCAEAKQEFLDQYFSVVEAFRQAAEQFRRGVFDVEFPPGTFRPHGMCLLV